MPATSEFHLFGSYSTGTLRIQDLLPAAIDAAEDLAKWLGETPQDLADAIAEAWRGLAALNAATDDDGEALYGAVEAYNDLCDAIDSHCPPYVSYRSHIGDGADVGFWCEWDVIEEDRHCGELADMDDEGGVDDPGATLALHVNDHGNATLYARDSADSEWRIVWSVV